MGKNILIVVLVIAVLMGIDFLFAVLLLKGICWAFGLTFSYKYAFGIWLILLLLQGYFKNSNSHD